VDAPNVLRGKAAVGSEDLCCEMAGREEVRGMGRSVSAQGC
jgi:hypothetical protein